MLMVLILAIFGITLAMYWNEGLWSTAIMVINATLGGLIAINYFEPLASYLDGQMGTYTYFWDFLSLWLIFAVSTGVLRAITDTISRHKVKFKFPVEIAGKVVLALYVGWILTSFTLFSLHTAPLPTDMFYGSFQKAPTSTNFMNGDRRWMGFMQFVSLGSLARGENDPNVGENNRRPFDKNGEFIVKYRQRRATQEQQSDFRVLRQGS